MTQLLDQVLGVPAHAHNHPKSEKHNAFVLAPSTASRSASIGFILGFMSPPGDAPWYH